VRAALDHSPRPFVIIADNCDAIRRSVGDSAKYYADALYCYPIYRAAFITASRKGIGHQQTSAFLDSRSFLSDGTNRGLAREHDDQVRPW